MQITPDLLGSLLALLVSQSGAAYAADSEQTSEVGETVKDFLWLKEPVWELLNLITGGALVKTVPIAASCYDSLGVYNKARCRIADPTSVMWPLYQGCTCQPGKKVEGNCTLGGYPSYVVDAQNVAHLQLAINLARLLNMQLVIKNTGHDFNGRSAGAGALSIWTYRFKGI
ncbi:FAD-linked oxidoreductase ZEB1 [Fusarium oxysporum f. sp. rapae]|uniref:FAD-linked oxidoreductase ZEB1 n=1 Tax=Fusarium oxysporum f. sp. rapae TaxID=485398 RepID=A0A8J5NK52_FUSOX|nr:FAD-linked oxidoreductase ZEB1 [Fusarium oxysporum f. sp. rapae]